MPGRWLKHFRHPPVRNREFLWKDPSLCSDAHEVCIANPPRHDVQMEVLADSGAGAMSEIHPHVEPFRPIQRAQRPHATLSQLHHFSHLLGSCFIEASSVDERRNHEVAGGIGKQIQNHEIERAAINDQAARVLGRIFSDTEDARGALLAD